MDAFFRKRTLTLYWIVLVVHCVFMYFELPYIAVTKPMFVPLLLLQILLNDHNIGSPAGKFVFYIGLMLSFLGDVLLIVITDTFFLGGMITFLFVNLFYSYSFFSLTRFRIPKVLPVLGTVIMLYFIAEFLFRFLGDELGSYKLPGIAYVMAISLTVLTAVNAAGVERYRTVALNYLIPGAMIFVIEHIIVALNKFHLGRSNNLYIAGIITYCWTQYLFVKGVLKAYL